MKVRMTLEDGRTYIIQAYRDLPTTKSVMGFILSVLFFGAGLALIVSLLAALLSQFANVIIAISALLYVLIICLAYVGRFYGFYVYCPRCGRSFLLYHGVRQCSYCRMRFTLEFLGVE